MKASTSAPDGALPFSCALCAGCRPKSEQYRDMAESTEVKSNEGAWAVLGAACGAAEAVATVAVVLGVALEEVERERTVTEAGVAEVAGAAAAEDKAGNTEEGV